MLAILGALAILLSSVNALAAITANELAVIVNDDDPQSLTIGEYYRVQRGIPAANIVHVALGVPQPVITPAVFETAFIKARMRTLQGIEGYALAWRYPYRVGCQSITTAFALGYSPRYCADGCRPTAPNPYYAAETGKPHRDFQLYPSMMLAAESLGNARALIDRGVRSDGIQPRGRAYLVITAEAARNTRAPLFPAVQTALGQRIPVIIERSAGIRDRRDVMFYFTGTIQVPFLETLGFLPGAIADHLTSFGGDFRASDQMSALRWLEAGATASYGTVLEPCNFPQKFPSPGILMAAYLAGDTALEAYWKSVAWPGQGVFVGEALARPYGPPPAALKQP